MHFSSILILLVFRLIKSLVLKKRFFFFFPLLEILVSFDWCHLNKLSKLSFHNCMIS